MIMIQLSRAPLLFLLVSILYQALTLPENHKIHPQVRIVWSLSAAICAQRGYFEKHKKIQPPLNKLVAYESQEKQPCSYITRIHCENSDCKRFQCKNNQNRKSVGVQVQATSSSEKQQSTLTKPGTGTGPNIIVRLKSQQKCEAVTIPCKNNTGCYVPSNKRAIQVTSIVDSLKAYATKTQAAVLNILKSSSFKSAMSIEPLWITNEIIVKGALLSDVQNLLKSNSDVNEVRAERLFKIPEVSLSRSSKTEKSNGVDDWNIRAVDAHKVWSQGITGKGITVGHIDTGVSVEHEALKNNFRGEYGWFDPYAGKLDPYDDQGHGTHTMGTAVGQKKDIGVAPGATWMSCKGCRADGNCTESATKTCAQWFLCPTKADGTDPDCSKAPLVVNNSWGDPVLEDGTDAMYQAEFQEIIQCWRSAGIIPVFCTGNSGWWCETTWYPALLGNVIAVGNVEQNFDPNSTLEFAAYHDSSRGPPNQRFAQVVKPEVSAPGTRVFSASSSDPQEYHAMTGTSQAAPLVTGTIALLLQKYSSLHYDYDQVLAALIQSCSPVFIPWMPRLCGNISENVWPNNHMGFGMINAYKVVFGAETSEKDCQ